MYARVEMTTYVRPRCRLAQFARDDPFNDRLGFGSSFKKREKNR